MTPARTATGRRTYTDEDLERLRLLRQATLGGRRIGDVATLSTGALRQLVAGDATELARAPSPPSERPDAPEEDWLEHGMAAVRALDTANLEAALRRALLALGVSVFNESVIIPLVHRIGRLWEDGGLDPYEEHFATVVVRRILEETIRDGSEDAGRPSLLVGTPAGQRHEIGALLAAATACAHGWRAIYLGPDLPADDIARAARTRRAQAVALSIVYPTTDPQLARELQNLRELLPRSVPILVGGAGAASFRRVLGTIGAVTTPNLQDLGAVLNDLGRKGTSGRAAGASWNTSDRD